MSFILLLPVIEVYVFALLMAWSICKWSCLMSANKKWYCVKHVLFTLYVMRCLTDSFSWWILLRCEGCYTVCASNVDIFYSIRIGPVSTAYLLIFFSCFMTNKNYIFVCFQLMCLAAESAKSKTSLIQQITDPKEFKKFLRTHTNVLVVFAKSSKNFF